MEKKESEILDYVKELVSKEQRRSYNNSKGTIILKNGFVFQISHMFNFFRDNWFAFTKALLEPEGEQKDLLIKMSNNGITTNGIISIDLEDVSAMVGENQESMLHFPSIDEDHVIQDDVNFNNEDEDDEDIVENLNFN